MAVRANLLGQKFNMLTVVEGYHDPEHSCMKWICTCDCGSPKNVIAIGADLKRGRVKSCGCFRANHLQYGESAFNRLYNTYSRRARSKNLPFSFSKDEFKEITSLPCAYCGIEPKQVASKGNDRTYGEYIYNGIDRIDSNKGYEEGNVVPCCGQCNVAKNNYTYDEFMTWIHRLSKNLRL